MSAALLQQAQQLDQADQLAHLRDEFYIPAQRIYFDGNSLGHHGNWGRYGKTLDVSA